jgi:formylglycine-generating enzyme required for sulfatase activity
MAEPVVLKYRGFISYSHADTSWAKWLHRALEGFTIDKDLAGRATATGSIPKTLRPIFRDRDEFTAGHTIPEQILAALDASHALIVICSPAAAKSRDVNEEIRLFKSRHPERPVVPLIVSGKPEDPELECFPQPLRFKLDADGKVTNEPIKLLAADAREEADGKSLALDKVIAGLLDVSSDDIFRRAERERRSALRRRQRVQAVFGVLLLLLAMMGGAWLYRDELLKQYYWRAFMGPSVLTAEQERALSTGGEFKECAKGCPSMVMVPAGRFLMGAPGGQGQDYEKPQHLVTIVQPFAVSKFEVTYDDWQACVDYGECRALGSTPHSERSRQPVASVTWDQATRYAAWLSSMSGKTYRLLSEAEWEYAARAGTQTTYSWGNEIGRGNANCNGCGSRWDNREAAPVGSFSPNAFGLYDMHGNVAEWVEDCGNNDYHGAPQDGSAWATGQCDMRVLRGGSWLNEPRIIASASRISSVPSMAYQHLGFRIARTLR